MLQQAAPPQCQHAVAQEDPVGELVVFVVWPLLQGWLDAAAPKDACQVEVHQQDPHPARAAYTAVSVPHMCYQLVTAACGSLQAAPLCHTDLQLGSGGAHAQPITPSMLHKAVVVGRW